MGQDSGLLEKIFCRMGRRHIQAYEARFEQQQRRIEELSVYTEKLMKELDEEKEALHGAQIALAEAYAYMQERKELNPHLEENLRNNNSLLEQLSNRIDMHEVKIRGMAAYTKVDIKGVRTFMESIQNLLQQLQRMQWSDYLDIAVVAFLIYKILPLIKTPSTTRIAKAVVVVLVIAWLTDLWHLYTVAFIMKQFLSVGLLALVILFQPELRRMLDHLGSVKLTSIFGVSKPVQQEMDAVITHTVRACEAMGREKVGALIAFAREQRLEEYFKTGTQIDGQVSDQLIRNIFFKNSPLHDGAMIIRDGRIAAAGCVLPLSDSNHLSADLGTRHRAGVGMSEASDAVVVIVSEETGTISVAVGGMLTRHLAPQTLDKLLHNELCPADDDEKQDLGLRLKQKLYFRRKETDDNEK